MAPSKALMMFIAAAIPMASAKVGKSTYAMSHPWAYKAFMEKYLPTAENIARQNDTKACNEWVKLCIDDGTVPFRCSGPQGNTQVHAVGAYERDSGKYSMEDLEGMLTDSLGGMKNYSQWMELHIMFSTSDLDGYVSAFTAGGVAQFQSTFTASDGTKYYSTIVQVDGSLKEGAKSFILLDIVSTKSAILSAADAEGKLYKHTIPRASASALSAAAASPAKLTLTQVSWPSTNITRDVAYFEDVLGGKKVESGPKYYTGKLFSDDTVELRWVDHDVPTGSFSFGDFETYVNALHNTCIPKPNYNQQGFDRLADNHIGGHGMGGASLEQLIEKQIAAGLPYRVYQPPGATTQQKFLYLYGPNGWGYQITGSCTNTKLCSNTVFYDFCTQGIKGHCSKDS